MFQLQQFNNETGKYEVQGGGDDNESLAAYARETGMTSWRVVRVSADRPLKPHNRRIHMGTENPRWGNEPWPKRLTARWQWR